MTICGGLKYVRASMIKLPSPASAPMNSAPTMTKRARPKPSRKATIIPGNAPGSTTRRSRSPRVAPRLAAARNSITSTRSTAAATPMNMGKKVV